MTRVRRFLLLVVLVSGGASLVVFMGKSGHLLPEDKHRSILDEAGRQRHILQAASEISQTETHSKKSEEGSKEVPAFTSDQSHDQQHTSAIFSHPNTSSVPNAILQLNSMKIAQSPVATLVRNGGMNLSSEVHIITPSDTLKPADQDGARHCITPRKNVLFLKTHKTGSSTIQNILYRYGDKNGLTFALPVSDVYMGTPSLFEARFAKRSPSGKYNMLANHARYNRPEMEKVMYKDAAYVTVLRHPSMQSESMYTYYGFNRLFHADLAQFADNPRRYYLRQGAHPMHSSLNPTLYDLGLSKRELDQEGAIQTKIQTLDSEFDLVLISEYISESLVLLKDLMCWDFSDITYFSANKRTQSEVNAMSERTFSQLYKWNHGDALLYDQFNKTLWRKVDSYGRERMSRDIRTLEKMNEALMQKCLDGTKQERSMQTVISRYVLKSSATNDEQCPRMIRPAPKYLGILKKKQTDMFKQH